MLTYKWSAWEPEGCIGHGEATLNEIEKAIRRNSRQVLEDLAKMSREEQPDHMIVAVKFFGDNGLEECRFYNLGLDDDDFWDRVERLGDVRVYAYHKPYPQRASA